MSKSRDYELLVNEGRAQEKKCDWIAAVGPYDKASNAALRLNDFSKAAKIQEMIGFCFHRAAMQAKNLQEFKNRMLRAINAYSNAAELFEKVEGPEKLAKICHCKAVAAYINSWLKPDLASRKRLLDECWKLEKEALKFYEGVDDRLSLGKTCNELNTCLVDRLNLEWDKQIREKTLKEALSYGEKAIGILSELGEEYELARAYYTTSIHYYTAALGLELGKKKKYEQKALSYSKKAVELSEKIGDRFLFGMSNIRLGEAIADFAGRLDSSMKYFENALRCGIYTRDNYLIGYPSFCWAYVTFWKMVAEEDPDKIREESKKCEKHGERAVRHFSLISYDQEIAFSYSYGYAENYSFLAMFAETSSEKKRILLKKSVEAGRNGLEHARRSGSIRATWVILHSLSKSLFFLSTMETDADVKKRLLKESLRYREENIKALEQAMPYYFWNHGVFHNYLALIQAELAEIERDKEQKVKLLEDAIKSAENCINLCLKHGTLSRGQYAALGRYYSYLGGILNKLHLLTGTYELLSELIEVFKGAVEAYEKAELPSRAAEGYWQLAKAYNKLQNYAESAESFELAYENYVLAAEKIPPLKEFYLNHASYMKGWSEIEKAKYHHAERQYGQAKEHYKKAANLHKSTEQWNHLSPNYLAWARLEEAEDLSRREQTQEARDLFQQAAKLFVESKKSIKAKLEKIKYRDEKEMAAELVKASDIRREYCLGRIALEEAKILDRQGDHTVSSKKYGSAAEMFQKIAKAESEQTRKELQPIIYLCQAWQKMMMAEAKASSTMYGEAAELFKQAKEHTLDQPTSLLALANSSFCKALEAGTEFEITRDMTIYSTAKKHMEAAENYYLKAGFKTASEYAKATHRLFDAYMYMHKAETETEPRKKAQYYQMAEKLLQSSAGSYMKAKHPEKSEEVRRLMESVKEERELAISLTEVLHAPTIASTTASFSTPTPTQEQAVGLERFEHADIQANLIIHVKEVKVGEDLSLEIELVNTGKGPALLIKVEEIIPEGFKLKDKPEMYRVEDRYLNMKGKRLDPLKTEEVRLVLEPIAKGTFPLKPRILYLDETGKYRSHEPEPVTVTVKELGISGWLKGPSR